MRSRFTLPVALVAAALLWLGADRMRTEARAARESWPRNAGAIFVPPPGLARVLSLGYRELLATLTWCRALVYYGSGWGEGGDLSQIEELADLIVELDPRFEKFYQWAPYAVLYRTGEVTEADYRASLRYLERAMEEFPDDYRHFWAAGARYYFDLKPADEEERRRLREKGAALIEEAMYKPNAPPDLATTAAAMRSKLGQHERALDALRQMILVTDNAKARDKMLDRVRESNPDLADAIEEAWLELRNTWMAEAPALPLDMFLLLGPEPSRVIDFRDLATPHALFGADPDADPDPDPEAAE